MQIAEVNFGKNDVQFFFSENQTSIFPKLDLSICIGHDFATHSFSTRQYVAMQVSRIASYSNEDVITPYRWSRFASRGNVTEQAVPIGVEQGFVVCYAP